MDYVDNTLATNIMKSCPVDLKLRQGNIKYQLQMNLVLMSEVYKFQNEMWDSVPQRVTVKY